MIWRNSGINIVNDICKSGEFRHEMFGGLHFSDAINFNLEF